MIYYWIMVMLTIVMFGVVAMDMDREPDEPMWMSPIAITICGLLWPVAWSAVVYLWIKEVLESKGE
jgi:hypothetical protein